MACQNQDGVTAHRPVKLGVVAFEHLSSQFRVEDGERIGKPPASDQERTAGMNWMNWMNWDELSPWQIAIFVFLTQGGMSGLRRQG
jgi:hypothetical protein